MQSTLERLEAEALKLSSAERAQLAEHLLASLDEDSELDNAWALEVQRRIDAIESENARLIPVAEVLARSRAALK